MSTQHPLHALQQRVDKALNGEPIEPPITEDSLELLRQRNAERVKAAIAQLGPKWVGFTARQQRVYNAIADQRPEWAGA
jgi:hypothetical protein